ncbi:hypothetical protein FRC12_020866 [Ceratobasidium sp. 428]|nr:hypothetical protein FRC12_020866 [Ceratobasidium sp. 428]
MVSRLQLNLRSEFITSPRIPMSEDPGVLSPVSETRLREKQPDFSRTSTTLSSIIHFFQSTVTEMGRDVAVIEEGDKMNVAGAESDIEMGPIQLVRKDIAVVPAVCSSSSEEPERLENTSNATPAIEKS